jgi:hypothetical protein
MSDPKVLIDLRQVIFDSNLIAAETVTIFADETISTITDCDHATEALGGSLTQGAGSTGTGLTVIAGRLEHPRNVVLTQTVSGATGGYARVIGMGMKGELVSELFTLGAVTATLTGNVPFLTVTRVNVWGVTGTLAGGDMLKIGVGAKLGLPMGSDCELVDVVKERTAGTTGIIITPANINRTYGTYAPTTTLSAAALEIWYVTKRTLTY